MARIVNYAKKKKNCLSKRVMCLALFPRWSSACWPKPLPRLRFFWKCLGAELLQSTCDNRSLGQLGVHVHLVHQRQPEDLCFDPFGRDPAILSSLVGRQFPGEVGTGDVLHPGLGMGDKSAR